MWICKRDRYAILTHTHNDTIRNLRILPNLSTVRGIALFTQYNLTSASVYLTVFIVLHVEENSIRSFVFQEFKSVTVNDINSGNSRQCLVVLPRRLCLETDLRARWTLSALPRAGATDWTGEPASNRVPLLLNRSPTIRVPQDVITPAKQ